MFQDSFAQREAFPAPQSELELVELSSEELASVCGGVIPVGGWGVSQLSIIPVGGW